MIRVWRSILILFTFNLIVMGLAVVVGHATTGPELVYDTRINGDVDIFLLDLYHHLTVNLTHHAGEDSRPVWSPDGRLIAFESWRNGTRAVYVMDANGGNVHRLTNHTDASEYAPEWTPDGSAILFRYYKRPESAIFRVRPDGSDLQQVDAASTVQQPLDQERNVSAVYVDGAWGIVVTEGDTTRQLTSGNLIYQEMPQWSSDGSLIAFLSQDTSEIFALSNQGTSLRQITTDGAPKSNLRWRP